MTPLKEIEVLSNVVRTQIKEYARVSAHYYKLVVLASFDDAKKDFIAEARISPGYPKMKEAFEGIIVDCVEKFKMEQWWAEAFLGIDIDRELLKEFDKAWKEVPTNE